MTRLIKLGNGGSTELSYARTATKALHVLLQLEAEVCVDTGRNGADYGRTSDNPFVVPPRAVPTPGLPDAMRSGG